MIDLRCGDWREVLADVECDALICDPPYGKRTHDGHDAGAVGHLGDGKDSAERREIDYAHWTPGDVYGFVADWSPRVRGWFCAMTSHDLLPTWQMAFDVEHRYSFAPIPCVMRGMTCRLGGDGPSSWAVYLVVARPRNSAFAKWGTLPGAYVGAREHGIVVGAKPEWLMRAIVGDYSRPGDIVCDPCAGGGTTLIAADGMGRHAIGAELDPVTHAKAMERIARGVQQEMFA